MAYYECTYTNDHINIGDSFTVTLTGSHNTTTTATVCYVDYADDITICLLGDTSLATANWGPIYACSWNYTVNINNKKYTGICRIPTLQQIYSKCAGYKRNFHYWTSTRFDGSIIWYVNSNGGVNYITDGNNYGALPFIEITL